MRVVFIPHPHMLTGFESYIYLQFALQIIAALYSLRSTHSTYVLHLVLLNWQLPGNDYIFFQNVVLDAAGHVRERQPEQLGIPARRVASAGPDGSHSELHAVDHIHRVTPSVALVVCFAQAYRPKEEGK